MARRKSAPSKYDGPNRRVPHAHPYGFVFGATSSGRALWLLPEFIETLIARPQRFVSLREWMSREIAGGRAKWVYFEGRPRQAVNASRLYTDISSFAHVFSGIKDNYCCFNGREYVSGEYAVNVLRVFNDRRELYEQCYRQKIACTLGVGSKGLEPCLSWPELRQSFIDVCILDIDGQSVIDGVRFGNVTAVAALLGRYKTSLSGLKDKISKVPSRRARCANGTFTEAYDLEAALVAIHENLGIDRGGEEIDSNLFLHEGEQWGSAFALANALGLGVNAVRRRIDQSLDELKCHSFIGVRGRQDVFRLEDVRGLCLDLVAPVVQPSPEGFYLINNEAYVSESQIIAAVPMAYDTVKKLVGSCSVITIRTPRLKPIKVYSAIEVDLVLRSKKGMGFAWMSRLLQTETTSPV